MDNYDKSFFMQYLLAEDAMLKHNIDVIRFKLQSCPYDEALIQAYFEAVVRYSQFKAFSEKLYKVLKFLP